VVQNLTINYHQRVKSLTLESKIGVFVVMGLSSLFVMSTQVSEIPGFNQDGYEITAEINDATGLQKESHVSMNGVDIGEIKAIRIVGRKVLVTLVVQDAVEIPSDSIILVTQESVLGGKKINILAGESPQNIQSHGKITHFRQYAAFDETSDAVNKAAKELELLMHDMRDVLDEEHKRDMKDAITAFKNVGQHLDLIVLENRVALRQAIENMRTMGEGFTQTATTVNQDLPAIMARIDSLTRRLDTISTSLEHKLPMAVDKFIALEDNVSTMMNENRDSLKSALSNADGFFASGQTAFDKVDSLLSNFTVSELQVGLHSDYMFSDEYLKSHLTVSYLPNPETYYMLDLIAMNDYSRLGVEPSLHEKSKILLSAQYGKRFNSLLFRGGLIESSGGIGVDYITNHDNLMVSMQVFDFNAVNDVRGTQAHMEFSVRYRFLKHLEVYGGWDNFLNSEAQNIYLGVGIKFIDNNLKYLIGASSMAL